MEELEAVDWYDQRVHAAHDDELRAILAHNRDEEKEHAAMVLEWLRRHDAHLDEQLRTYLFADKSVLEIEEPGAMRRAAARGSRRIARHRQPARGGAVMNDLLRDLAPISEAAWATIEEEARRTLKLTLAARKLVDFRGPLGWDASAVSNGRARRLSAGPEPGVEARMREVQPLVELRVPFELTREELEAVGRGAADPDLTRSGRRPATPGWPRTARCSTAMPRAASPASPRPRRQRP